MVTASCSYQKGSKSRQNSCHVQPAENIGNFSATRVDAQKVKAVVKYVGGFWPIGVFFAGYRSFFLFLVDKLRRKHAFKHANKKKTRENCCIVQVTCVQIFPNTS